MNGPGTPEFERELSAVLSALAEEARPSLLDRTMAAVAVTPQRTGLGARFVSRSVRPAWPRIGATAVVAAGALLVGIAIGTSGLIPMLIAPSPSASTQASPSVIPSVELPAGGWTEVTIQPRGGPGDLVVQDGHAGQSGLVLTGQLAGPLAEQRGAVDPVAWYSQDGLTWHPSDFEMSGLEVDAFDIGPVFEAGARLMAFGTGRYVDTGTFTAVRFESRDGGATWFLQDAPSLPGSAVITDVAAGGPGYVAVGYGVTGVSDDVVTQSPNMNQDSSTPGAVVWVSIDGLRWQPVGSVDQRPFSYVAFGSFNAIASNGGLLVAVGGTWIDSDGRPDGRVWTSVDGLQWTQADEPTEEGAILRDVVAAGEGFVAVGLAPRGPAAWWSQDGEIWIRVDLEDGGARYAESVVELAGGFVAVGDGTDHAVAWRSVDGRSWGPAEPLGAGAAAHVVLPFGNGALAAGTTLATSTASAAKEPIAWVTPP